MIQGPAKSSDLVEAGFAGGSGSNTSLTASGLGCLWNATSQKFELTFSEENETVADSVKSYARDTAATGAMAAVTYEVKVVDATGIRPQDEHSHDIYDISEDWRDITASKSTATNTDGGKTITLSFGTVMARTHTHDSSDNAVQGTYESRNLSDLHGRQFTVSLRASNANGYTTTSGDIAFAGARQVFSAKSVIAGLTPAAAKVAVSGTDMRKDGSDYYLSATASDFTFANTGGRNIDDINWEVTQTMSDTTVNTVAKGSLGDQLLRSNTVISAGTDNGDFEDVEVDSATSKVHAPGTGGNFYSYNGTPTSGINAQTTTYDLANKLNFKFAAAGTTGGGSTDVELGYPFTLKLTYVSNGVATTLSQTGITGATGTANAIQDFESTTKSITYSTAPLPTDDECAQMNALEGDHELTVYWSKPAAAYATNADPDFKGYILDLYDEMAYSDTGHNGDASDVTFAPAFSHSYLSGTGPLGRTVTQHKFSGLLNGKHYTPILRTVNTSGASVVTSKGRTLDGAINANYEAHSVEVVATSTSTAVLRTVIRYKTIAATGSGGTAVAAGTDVTGTVFSSTARQVTFGLPVVTASVAAGANQTLTIDNNGSPLLYGSMLQVARATGATSTLTTTGVIGTAPGAPGSSSDIFYLDLSFGAGVDGVQNVGGTGSTRELYVTGGVTYPGRMVTTVGKTFLGDNWSTETNYVFASNAAGTTAGKISASASNGVDTSI